MTEKNAGIPVLMPTFGDTGEMTRRFEELFRTGRITLGRYTRELEAEVGRLLGVEHVVAVSSCTAGLMLAIKALGLSGEVILPSFTFAATGHALVWCGLRPVFCDCDPETLGLDLEHAATLAGDRTSGIMPVYVFGAPPDWDRVGEFAAARALRVVADAAQGLGASFRGRRTGGFGDVEVFSMSPTKVVTAGEGGLVTTRDGGLAREIRKMRDYGKAEDGEDMDWVGLSARLSEFHAVIALENLRHLEEWTERRRRILALYRSELSGIPGIRYPALPPESASSLNYMVILISAAEAPFGRDDLYRHLKERGIQTKRYFYPPVHRLRAFRALLPGSPPGLPVTERVAGEALALPLFSHIAEATVRAVCSAIRALA